MNNRLVIVDGVRTPFCRAGSELAALAADELGRIAVNALLTRTGLDPALIDEVIFGCVAQPMESANIARVIALRAGIPESVPAVTVHRNCASGFEAITTAYERLATDRGSVFVVGGTESMSQIPMLFKAATAQKFAALAKSKSTRAKLSALAAFRPADFEPRIGLKLGLADPVSGLNMGETAELLAREFAISRQEQDAFALRSHQRALAGHKKLEEEICAVYAAKTISRDNGPRSEQTLSILAGLRPVFDKHGTVTAGNSSQITDGAAALLVMGESRAHELGFKPLGVLIDYAYAGCDPARMGLGPVFAINKLENRSGLSVGQADIVEINEAFAAQVLAVQRRLPEPIPDEKLNVNGGAIALGHPVGTTGARLVLSALKELQRRDGQRALVSACVGGGQGAALWLERAQS
ncbi:MAG: acetyl-CoA acetyltransferase [Chthoniobacteraceae bacterium]|nr:acetyl-CoA acetyltransferase [Chthoniobacteraceae bacterium]